MHLILFLLRDTEVHPFCTITICTVINTFESAIPQFLVSGSKTQKYKLMKPSLLKIALSDFPHYAILSSFPSHHIFIVCLLFITGCYIWICSFGIVCNINANWFLTWYHKFHRRKCVSRCENGEMLKSQKWLQWRHGIVESFHMGRRGKWQLWLHGNCFKIIILLLK